MINIIFIAPPSAGKGTISEYLINNYDYSHLSTGDLLREEINKNSNIGKMVKAIIDQGNLVDDGIITSLLEDKLSKINNRFILDGYPRNVNQAELLDGMFKNLNIKNVAVINLDIKKEILLNRILNRRICPSCHKIYNLSNESMYPLLKEGKYLCKDCNVEVIQRDDDNEVTFNNRYNVYLSETYPIVDYFKDKGYKIYNVDASKELQVVFNEIDNILGDN